VRDLLDSMYRGYPVGYLLFWKTGGGEGVTRPIGTDAKQYKVASQLIVDGQQRLTSLYAVLTGTSVVRNNFDRVELKIAFRPSDGAFAVADAATDNDPEFIANVTSVWAGSEFTTNKDFLRRLRERREVDEVEEARLTAAISHLNNLENYHFRIVELNADVDEENVAEVFVRINSEGVTLNQSDFILTLMSVWWEQGRRDLEAFSRATKDAAWPREGELEMLGTSLPFGRAGAERKGAARAYNHHFQPGPTQLLRASIAFAFRRAVLRSAYTLLRGRDVENGASDPVKREEQFHKLEVAQADVLDLLHWHEFLLCLERAGFRSVRLITSENAIVYAYALWLIGRVDFQVPVARLRELMARWVFMAQLTSRYSGSFETQFEADVSVVRDLTPGDTAGFVAALDRIIDTTLTPDFWAITLPDSLDSSAAKSPSLVAYIASLCILDADIFMSNVKVRTRLDPRILASKSVERHHLFPRAYLRNSLGVTTVRVINQIANMALVDWVENIGVSDLPPSVYWPRERDQGVVKPERLARQLHHHALPDGWENMPYEEFLVARRRLMAAIVREGFKELSNAAYQVELPVEGPQPLVAVEPGMAHGSLSALIDAGLLSAGAVVIARGAGDVAAEVTDDGALVLDGERFESPSAAAKAVTGTAVNGWNYWIADTSTEGLLSLADLRARLAEED
jgi:hypothetical protein